MCVFEQEVITSVSSIMTLPIITEICIILQCLITGLIIDNGAQQSFFVV